jgi:beta-glucuronidase
MNANYVRGAHYPQSPSWLDRLDEAGIAMWEETLGPGVSLKNTQDPVFMAAHLAAMAAMVQTSFAHPSVLFHGFFNEGPSNDAAACPAYEASAEVSSSPSLPFPPLLPAACPLSGVGSLAIWV